jgi:hypothetical protein
MTEFKTKVERRHRVRAMVARMTADEAGAVGARWHEIGLFHRSYC